MRSFDLLRLSVIYVSYALRRLARFRAREGKSDPPSALSALLSYRSVHEGVRRELLGSREDFPLREIPSWKFRILHGFLFIK